MNPFKIASYIIIICIIGLLIHIYCNYSCSYDNGIDSQLYTVIHGFNNTFNKAFAKDSCKIISNLMIHDKKVGLNMARLNNLLNKAHNANLIYIVDCHTNVGITPKNNTTSIVEKMDLMYEKNHQTYFDDLKANLTNTLRNQNNESMSIWINVIGKSNVKTMLFIFEYTNNNIEYKIYYCRYIARNNDRIIYA